MLCPTDVFAVSGISAEAEFLEEIKTKVIRVFLLVTHSPLYSFALSLQPLTVSVREKGVKP
jgi:hypothetical protein